MSDIGFLINEAAGRLKRTLSTAVSQPYLTSACQLTLQEVQKSLRDMTTLLTPFEYQLRFGVPMHSSLSPAISFARELKREASWFVEIVRGWIPPEVPSILAAWEVAFEGDGSKDDVEKDKELAGHSMMGFQLGVMWDSNDQEPNMPAIDISNSVSASRIKRSPTTTSFETAPSLVNTISTIPTTTTSTVTPSRSAAQADLAALIAVKVHILNHANSTQTPSPPQNGLTKRHLEKQLPHQPHGAHEAKYVMIFWYLQELHTGDPSLTGMFQNPPPPPPKRSNHKSITRP
ncbi:hypothetical protein DFH27DRAFT_308345 [Peziza echinospora]|nr:hypothetical protein DFH27DRAFT_308345 [Peziza echinospora]